MIPYVLNYAIQAYAEVNYLRFCQCPHFSASEVTTLRRYTNLFIIIIIIIIIRFPRKSVSLETKRGR